MSLTLIRDCRASDGSGEAAFSADLPIGGGRIRAVSRGRNQLDGRDAEVIKAGGMTVKAGAGEGERSPFLRQRGCEHRPWRPATGEHTLLTARNARALLDQGFTSAYSAVSAKLRLDIAIRNAIAAGEIPGPRLKACGPGITLTGGLGDERNVHMYRDSFDDERRWSGVNRQMGPTVLPPRRRLYKAQYLRRQFIPGRQARDDGDERGRDQHRSRGGPPSIARSTLIAGRPNP